MKYKTKRFFKTVALILVGAILGGSLLVVSGNATTPEFLQREKNEANLIEVNDSYLKEGTNDNGVNWKVDDDGTIRFFGKSSTDHSIIVAEVDLDAGKYTYSIGKDNVNKGDWCSYVLYGGSGEAVAGTDSATFEIAEAQTVKIVINWSKDYDFGTVLGTVVRPVLVSGASAGSFYVK